MPFIQVLNSKGKLSLKKFKEEYNNFVEQENLERKARLANLIALIILALIQLFVIYACFSFGKFANASAVFDNTSSTEMISGAETACADPTDYRFPLWTFSSSTLQLELTDVTLFLESPNYGATTTLKLYVSTDQGTWSATTTQYTEYGIYATTTFNFSYPHPWASVGTDWDFYLDVPATSTLYQIMLQGTHNQIDVSAYTQFWGCNDHGLSCLHQTDVYAPPYYYAPQFILNASGLGGLTATIPPNAADYNLTGTSSAMTQDLGYFGNMFRDVMLWLFEPDSAVNYLFESKKTELLTNKSPFAYFNQSIALFNSFGTSTPEVLTINATTTLGSIEFFDSSKIQSSTLWVDWGNYLLTIESIIMWLGFLFYLYERLRDLQI